MKDFFCEDDNGERYYFFESEVDIVQDTILDSFHQKRDLVHILN